MSKFSGSLFFHSSIVALMLALSACSTAGTVGIIAKAGLDPLERIRTQPVTDLGAAQARSCRFVILGIAPGGNADVAFVLDKALKKSGGDAIVNATTTNSLYSLIPIYNIAAWTCVEIKGTAIKFGAPAAASPSPTNAPAPDQPAKTP